MPPNPAPPPRFADRLLAAIDARGAPVCVGIDPVLDRLPRDFRTRAHRAGALDADSAVDLLFEFSCGILDAVANVVPIVKIQAACFERYREPGVEALWSLVAEARDRDLLVILDAKRGDIPVSADHYAAGFFDPLPSDADDPGRAVLPDAVTVNPYFGREGIEPFCRNGRGAFALVRTSNPGGDEIQSAKLNSGRTVAQHIALMINDLAADFMGASGYSDLGAVVGATHPRELAAFRELMPRAILLLPGYGAQGGSARDLRACFDSAGRGALVTASRSVIYAFDESESDWSSAVASAASQFADDVRSTIRGDHIR